MATWSSFEKDKLLVEGWRKFLQEEEPQVVYGLNSENPDSLQSLLKGVVDEEQIRKIINLIASAADDEGVMLEAVSLQGSKSEQDRVFSGDTTREILQGLASLQLEPAKLKNVIKVLNQWGKLNTVKFEKPAPATPAMVTGEPDEAEGAPTPAAEPDPAAEPETVDEPAPDEPDPDPDPAAETGELEDEERAAKGKAKEAAPQEIEQKKQERAEQIQILKQVDEPDKGFLGLLLNNPFNFAFNVPKNAIEGLIRIYKLESEQKTKGNISKIIIEELFDVADSTIAFDLLPDNTPYLIKEKKFNDLFSGLLTNFATKGGKALEASVKLCSTCKGVIGGQAIISKIPKVGAPAVALAKAIGAIACPIAKIAPKLRPLLKGDPSGFSKNPFFTAGLSGKVATNSGGKLVISDEGTVERANVSNAVAAISGANLQNQDDAEMYALGLQSYAGILKGLGELDTSDIIADSPEESDTEKVTTPPTPPPDAPDTSPDPEQDTQKEPLGVIKEMLKDKVTDEQLQAFINDLRSLKKRLKDKPVKEISIRRAASELGIPRRRYQQLRDSHPEIFSALRLIRGDAAQQFLQALAKVVMEPAPQAAPEPEPDDFVDDEDFVDEPYEEAPRFNWDSGPEWKIGDEEDTKSDPIKELRSYIDQVKEIINKYNEEEYHKYVLPTSLDVVKDFKNKYLELVEEKTKKPPDEADVIFTDRINDLVSRLPRDSDRTKIQAINFYGERIKGGKEELTFPEAVDIYEEIIQPISNYIETKSDPEDTQPPSRPEKKGPEIKNQEAYDHGKQGKVMAPSGNLPDRMVATSLPKAIEGLTAPISRAEGDLKDKLESYRQGLEAYQDDLDTKIQFRPLFEDEKFKSASLRRNKNAYSMGETGNSSMYSKATNSYNSTGRPMSIEKAYKEWNERYDLMGSKEHIDDAPGYIETTKPYLQGLKKYIEDRTGLQKADKFLNNKNISDFTKEIVSNLDESLMLRWKTIAGIK